MVEGLNVSSDRSDDRLVIQILALIALVCVVGVIVEDVAEVKAGSDALLTIGSLAVGALAGRISSKAGPELGPTTNVVVKDDSRQAAAGGSSVEDDFAVIGRAATRSIIAEALHQMAVPPTTRSTDVHPPSDAETAPPIQE